LVGGRILSRQALSVQPGRGGRLHVSRRAVMLWS